MVESQRSGSEIKTQKRKKKNMEQIQVSTCFTSVYAEMKRNMQKKKTGQTEERKKKNSMTAITHHRKLKQREQHGDILIIKQQ